MNDQLPADGHRVAVTLLSQGTPPGTRKRGTTRCRKRTESETRHSFQPGLQPDTERNRNSAC